MEGLGSTRSVLQDGDLIAPSTAAMAPASGLMESSIRCSAAGQRRAFRPVGSCSSSSSSVSARRPVLAGSLSSTAGVFAGAKPARAFRAQRRHAVRQAATCQAAAEKFTVAITGGFLLQKYHNHLSLDQ